MKKIISTLCIASSTSLLFGTVMPERAHAGGWATVGQGQAIIARLRGINNNIVKNGENIKDLEKQVEDSMKESADRIIAALRSHSGEQSAYQDKQIEANRRITDAAEMNQTQRMRQQFRAEAESGAYDPNPGICLLAGLFRDNGSTPDTPRGSTTVAGARAKNNGADEAVRLGGTAKDTAQVTERSTLTGAMGFEDPTVDAAAILQNPTLTIRTEQDRLAAERLVRNLVDPNPPKPVTSAEMATPQGVARAAARTRQETRNNASAEAISMVMNMRTEVGPLEPWEPYIEDISNYNRLISGQEQVSELQAIDIRALRHYAPKPEKFQERASWSERQLLQELLDVMAVNTRISYLQLELDSRRAIVETQILSVLNNGG